MKRFKVIESKSLWTPAFLGVTDFITFYLIVIKRKLKNVDYKRSDRKKATVVAAESRGAIRAVCEVLHYGGYNIIGKITQPGTKNAFKISKKNLARTENIEQWL